MDAPIHYTYHPETGELSGSNYSDASPLETDVWVLPALATYEEPPVLTENHVAVFNDGAWEVFPDHRGETWWKDGEPFTLITFGDPTLEGFIAEGPPVVTAKQAVVWENDAWAIKPDHRGETWWIAYQQPVEIEELGDPADLGLLEDEPDAPPPSSDPNDYDLNRFQFIWMLRKLDVKSAVFAVAEGLPEVNEQEKDYKYEVLTLLEEGQSFRRAHPAFDQLGQHPSINLTPQQIDTAWMTAKDKQPMAV